MASGAGSRVDVAGSATADIWTVAAPSPSHYRLGMLRFDGNPYKKSQSLFTAIQAFGRPSSCVENIAPETFATWAEIGLRGQFDTLGGVPAGKNQSGCAWPRWVHPDHYDLLDRRWHTDRGIAAGSSVAHLQALYPSATKHGSDYWLSTRPAPWAGPHARLGLLIAHTAAGRVTGLELSLQAQGE